MNVTCRHCKFIQRIDHHFGGPSYKCGHESAITSRSQDPITGQLKITSVECGDKNADLDCEDFEPADLYTFWEFLKRRFQWLK